MQPVWLEGKKYFAEGARPSTGLFPWTCTAFRATPVGLFPVKTQSKLYTLSKILRRETKEIVK